MLISVSTVLSAQTDHHLTFGDPIEVGTRLHLGGGDLYDAYSYAAAGYGGV